MSIVDGTGERVFLYPEPDCARPVRSGRVRRRNREWLAEQRRLDLTVRELAKHLGVAVTTLGQGLLWAEEEETRAEAAAVERERRELSPVLDEASGLDLHDVLFLAAEYPPGTELGDHPLVRRVMGPLLARADALLAPFAEPAAA